MRARSRTAGNASVCSCEWNSNRALQLYHIGQRKIRRPRTRGSFFRQHTPRSRISTGQHIKIPRVFLLSFLLFFFFFVLFRVISSSARIVRIKCKFQAELSAVELSLRRSFSSGDRTRGEKCPRASGARQLARGSALK